MTGAVGNYETQSSSPIHWLGLTSVYTRDERQIMSALTVREQTLLHVLKSLTPGGELLGNSVLKSLTSGEITESDSQVVNSKPQEAPRGDESTEAKVYVDPDDLDFGKSEPSRVRRKKTYALVWTWQKHCVYKTKGKAQAKLKTWKKWYERQGWTVQKVGAGYLATSGNQRHVVQLHEYDAETRKRLA